MANGEMWDKLFERIDSLKAELKPSETDARDALALGLYDISLSFLLFVMDHPSEARRLKDAIVSGLKQVPLSPKRREVITDMLTDICDLVEEVKQS
jgi:hypothetical protein